MTAFDTVDHGILLQRLQRFFGIIYHGCHSPVVSVSCWDGRTTYDAEMLGQLRAGHASGPSAGRSGRESHRLLLKIFLQYFAITSILAAITER